MDNVPEFYQFLATMGVGGILAGFAMWMLNKAWKDHAEYVKSHNENEKGRTDMLVDCIKDNTIQTTTLSVVVNALHRRLDKEEFDNGRKLS